MSSDHDNQHEPVSGIDGVLCPVCGDIVKSLPVLVHRIAGDREERFRVCSPACKEIALRSPYLQTSLFGRDLRGRTQTEQSALRFPDRRNGDGSDRKRSGDAGGRSGILPTER